MTIALGRPTPLLADPAARKRLTEQGERLARRYAVDQWLQTLRSLYRTVAV